MGVTGVVRYAAAVGRERNVFGNGHMDEARKIVVLVVIIDRLNAVPVCAVAVILEKVFISEWLDLFVTHTSLSMLLSFQ